ncbi:cell division protein FtsA [Xylocopilactobacillus apicola]|uniref:Cell division protein FtsA n=1 Tax=Xylocopilactobacillus apicola TaxID=2932184 RepID=A0AAU9DBW9_9LACO|nr:cell division protein FtsA [Xylocopilactobacillus apicola]BDR58307.1 cell division protein FtsA [Xylocopilactobacillus apicola]
MENDSQAFVGIDLGTSFIKIIAMKAANKQINVIGVGIAQSQGMNKGMVVDIDQTINDILTAKADLDKKTQVPVDQVTVGIPTGYLTIEKLVGSFELSKSPREVNENDLQQLVGQMLKEHRTSDRDFVGIAVENFSVDNFNGISDPLGMIGTRLSLKCLVYSIPSTIFRNILKCVEGAGFKVKNLVLNPVSVAEVALNKAQREMGAIVIDAGSGQTSVSIFQNNLLIGNDTIFEGGKNVTNDISKILRISEKDAESVKIDYGSLKTQQIKNDESFVIKTLDQSKEIKTRDKYLSEIISARFEQIFEQVKKVLIATHAFDLPGGIMITGGNTALPGTEKKISSILDKNVKVYLPNQIGLRNRIYTVVYGMVIHTWQLPRVQRILENSLDVNHIKNVQPRIPTEVEVEQVENLQIDQNSQPKKVKSQKKSGIISSISKWLRNLFE